MTNSPALVTRSALVGAGVDPAWLVARDALGGCARTASVGTRGGMCVAEVVAAAGDTARLGAAGAGPQATTCNARIKPIMQRFITTSCATPTHRSDDNTLTTGGSQLTGGDRWLTRYCELFNRLGDEKAEMFLYRLFSDIVPAEGRKERDPFGEIGASEANEAQGGIEIPIR